MMHEPWKLLFVVAVFVGLGGCGQQRIWTTAYANNPGNLKEKQEYFAVDDYPLFVVRAKDKTVGIDVLDLSQQGIRVAGRVEQRMKKSIDTIELTGQLGPGNYVVQLQIDGDTVDTWPFEIARPVVQDPLTTEPKGPPKDRRLQEIENRWPFLPPETKEAILAIVRAQRSQ